MTAETTLPGRIAANVRREMAAQGRKVKDLAEFLGVSYTAASDRYKGKQELLPSQVEALAEWLGVTVEYLFATKPLLERVGV